MYKPANLSGTLKVATVQIRQFGGLIATNHSLPSLMFYNPSFSHKKNHHFKFLIKPSIASSSTILFTSSETLEFLKLFIDIKP